MEEDREELEQLRRGKRKSPSAVIDQRLPSRGAHHEHMQGGHHLRLIKLGLIQFRVIEVADLDLGYQREQQEPHL